MNLNQPAFPLMDSCEHDKAPSLADPGMTLRDYFAAKALQGMLANPNTGHDKIFYDDGVHCLVTWAYQIAMAMMTCREVGIKASDDRIIIDQQDFRTEEEYLAALASRDAKTPTPKGPHT